MYPFIRYTKLTQDGKLLGIRVHAFLNSVFATFSSQYLGEAGLHHSAQILCQRQPLRYLKASGTWRKNMHISRGKVGINFSTSLFV